MQFKAHYLPKESGKAVSVTNGYSDIFMSPCRLVNITAIMPLFVKPNYSGEISHVVLIMNAVPITN